jgi:hypothetical protein
MIRPVQGPCLVVGTFDTDGAALALQQVEKFLGEPDRSR